MSMKKTDLARHLEKKLEGRQKGAGVNGRFSADAGALPDRKVQRRLDSAAGLVPFACKLPAKMTAALRERAAAHADGINGLVAELIQRGLNA